MNLRKKELCEKMMDQFLMLDKNQLLPLSLCLHLLVCKKCRSQVRYLSFAENTLAKTLQQMLPLGESKIKTIMKIIDSKYEENTICPVSFVNWIVVGIIMVLTMVIFVISDYSLGLSSIISLWVYLFFGLCIAVYAIIFVGSNMDFFIKKIDISKLERFA